MCLVEFWESCRDNCSFRSGGVGAVCRAVALGLMGILGVVFHWMMGVSGVGSTGRFWNTFWCMSYFLRERIQFLMFSALTK